MKNKGVVRFSKMHKKEILINGVKAIVNVPDSLLVEEKKDRD